MEHTFPTTRYAGNKSKIVGWIWDQIKSMDFESCLDAFGGMGSVSYMLKSKNKKVHFNDILKCCYNMGVSLIENNDYKILNEEIDEIYRKNDEYEYTYFIKKTFKDIYYTDEENEWLDIVAYNISKLDNSFKKSMLLSALYQSCLIKRPFNLFHRKNLYLRLNNVKRSFYNHNLWGKPFDLFFNKFIDEINNAVFSNNKSNKATSKNVFDLDNDYDLVYLDPPYMSNKTYTNYLTLYHFLEGLSEYEQWGDYIDYSLKTKKYLLRDEISIWHHKTKVSDLFNKLIYKFKNSIIVLSYTSNSLLTEAQISRILKKYNKKVKISRITYQYALSPKKAHELLFIAT